jgi:asparagine synthase (glutamine-hydrolysing)
MCGIFGLTSTQPISASRREKFTICSKHQNHRGPNDNGEWWSSDFKVGFSHQRLSIIDLSELGHQPMLSLDNTISLIFNGEIYNYKSIKEKLISKGYKFISNTDTEVVIYAYQEWGIECVNMFIGMFAFSLFDSKINLIYLVRDRAGEKPLFYSTFNNELCFASELKTLMHFSDIPNKLNFSAFDCYLLMGYVPGDLCIIDNFNKLEPGHILSYEIETKNTKKWKYWNLPIYDKQINYKIDTLLEDFSILLQDSVNSQLVADVPVGVLLSGGVDSSLIAAMASRSDKRIKTFTVKFPGYNEFDESVHARLIANHFNTEHIELEAVSANVDLLNILARQFDEPMADSSMIPTYLVSKLIKEHCSVALGGDGGDELFGGYNSYSLLLKIKEQFKYLPYEFRKNIAKYSGSILPIGFKGRNYLQYANTNFETELPLFSTLFDKISRRKLINFDPNLSAEKIWVNRVVNDKDLIQRITRTDFSNYLPDDILVKVDKSSMLNSLEIRAPFLDFRIIEFAFSKLSSNLKVTQNDKKIFLKEFCKKILPENFDLRRKQGFSLPLSKWLREGPWHDYIYAILTDSSCVFDREQIINLFEGHKKGRNNSERLFSLALFQLWYMEYKIII